MFVIATLFKYGNLPQLYVSPSPTQPETWLNYSVVTFNPLA